MGCPCYNAKAAELQTQITEWETDQTNLIELQSLVETASSNVESYKNFFSNIHTILQRMIVNGTGFDADNCAKHMNSLSGVGSELSTLSGQIAAQLPILKDQIQGAKRTRAAYLQSTCNSCAAAAAEAAKKRGGANR